MEVSVRRSAPQSRTCFAAPHARLALQIKQSSPARLGEKDSESRRQCVLRANTASRSTPCIGSALRHRPGEANVRFARADSVRASVQADASAGTATKALSVLVAEPIAELVSASCAVLAGRPEVLALPVVEQERAVSTSRKLALGIAVGKGWSDPAVNARRVHFADTAIKSSVNADDITTTRRKAGYNNQDRHSAHGHPPPFAYTRYGPAAGLLRPRRLQPATASKSSNATGTALSHPV